MDGALGWSDRQTRRVLTARHQMNNSDDQLRDDDDEEAIGIGIGTSMKYWYNEILV